MKSSSLADCHMVPCLFMKFMHTCLHLVFIRLHCASTVITVCKADHGKIQVRIRVYTLKIQAIRRLETCEAIEENTQTVCNKIILKETLLDTRLLTTYSLENYVYLSKTLSVHLFHAMTIYSHRSALT